jgi:hypothetical protein
MQLNRIATYPDLYGGEGRARASFIMGIISTAAWIFIIGLLILIAL